jgi:hypothetical protein
MQTPRRITKTAPPKMTPVVTPGSMPFARFAMTGAGSLLPLSTDWADIRVVWTTIARNDAVLIMLMLVISVVGEGRKGCAESSIYEWFSKW